MNLPCRALRRGVAAGLEPPADHLTRVFDDQRGTGRSSLVSDSAQLAASWFVEDLDALRR